MDKELQALLDMGTLTDDDFEFLKTIKVVKGKIIVNGEREATKEERGRFARIIVKLLIDLYKDVYPDEKNPLQ